MDSSRIGRAAWQGEGGGRDRTAAGSGREAAFQASPSRKPEELGHGMFRHPAPGQDPRHVVGKPHDSRARQFVPFMALKGYHQLVRQQEAQPEPRMPRSDEDLHRLSQQLTQLERGQLVRVTRYVQDHYAPVCDRVRQVDVDLRILRLENHAVSFDHIDQILTDRD